MSMIRIEILSCHINKDANFKTYNVKHKFNKNFNKNCETNSFVIILSHKYNVLHAVKKLMGKLTVIHCIRHYLLVVTQITGLRSTTNTTWVQRTHMHMSFIMQQLQRT